MWCGPSALNSNPSLLDFWSEQELQKAGKALGRFDLAVAEQVAAAT